jgi:cell division protein FtsW
MRGTQRAGTHVLLIALTLVCLGTVMVYSSSSALASRRFANSGFFLERQIVRALIGLFFMFALSRVPIRLWAQGARWMLLAGLTALVLVLFLGVGPVGRWLQLPVFSFQPSEFAKLALVIYLADVLVRKEKEMGDFKQGLLPRLLVVGGVLLLIGLQPDLGTAIALGLIALVMLWLGGARLTHLLGTGLAVLPLIGLSLLISPYQWQRLAKFIKGLLYGGSGGNYQVEQALVALGSGGWLGVGLGSSLQKQQFLPEPHTDFVFALVGEELGLAGTLSVIGLFVALAIHGLRIAREAKSYFGFLVATGITGMISIYALLNIGVATGVLPTTGLPLPFISYGGSSLIGNLAGIGILVGVARSEEEAGAVWHQRAAMARPQVRRWR